MSPSPLWDVLRYHEETKHQPNRYAASPGHLDWATQPNPFRYFEGVTPTLLPLLKKDPEGGHLDLYERTSNPFWEFQFDPPPTLMNYHRRDLWGFQSVAAFLELSMGLSAWKSIPQGSRWALRMNPSSGNLHPTEAYVILPPMEDSDGGLYHYNPYLHALERRVALPRDYTDRLRAHFQSPGFLVGLTHIVWREAWKYGERALRYCHHDTGHALAAMSMAANLLGWKATYLNSLADDVVRNFLGIGQTRWSESEPEEADLLLFISPGHQKAVPRTLPAELVRAFAQFPWQGTPNQLSPGHVEWPLIANATLATQKPSLAEGSIRFAETPLIRTPTTTTPAAQLIRQRRSAVAFDGQTMITVAQFYAMLDKTMPRNGLAPFDLELGEPNIHLILFVHRVVGLEAGLYCLLRNPNEFMDLKRATGRDLLWEAISGPLPLYRLKSGDFQSQAIQISCQQTIAGRSAFSLAMLARFRPIIEREPWRYKSLFWEAGIVGQVLYLEAEAHGLRGTGIGCFFDDEMHRLLGLRTNDYQSLYHFTVGGAIDDPRLTTESPYGHLPKDRQ